MVKMMTKGTNNPCACHDEEYYCPVYDGVISTYDCSEVSFAAKHGWIPNDGLPPLMEVHQIAPKAGICKNCPHNTQSSS